MEEVAQRRCSERRGGGGGGGGGGNEYEEEPMGDFIMLYIHSLGAGR